MLLYILWEIYVQELPTESQEHWSPMNSDDSTVVLIKS